MTQTDRSSYPKEPHHNGTKQEIRNVQGRNRRLKANVIASVVVLASAIWTVHRGN